MTDAIYIYGAGGHGAVVAEIALALGHRVAGFIDDGPAMAGARVLGLPVLGGAAAIPDGAAVALAIGDNGVRAALLRRAREAGWRLPVLVHPTAAISPSAQLGEGTVAMAQAAVNARAVVGAAVILNTACSVDHDCRLADAVHIAPGVHLSGSVQVGAETLLGVGSCARPGITIGRGVTVGAGAVVVRDLPDGVVAYGNPARHSREAGSPV